MIKPRASGHTSGLIVSITTLKSVNALIKNDRYA